MKEVVSNLFVGDLNDCQFRTTKNIIHACKSPCHQHGVGYQGSLSQNHPNYLILSKENDLYLNIVDMETSLMPKFANPIFSAAMDFIDIKKSESVLIHCNQGQSRAPSIALVYLAKRAKTISNESYQKAIADFIKIYPEYNPAKGIAVYLSKNWNYLK